MAVPAEEEREVVDDEVIDCEIVADVGTAASGLPHWVGIYSDCVVVGSVDGSIDPAASFVGSIMKKVEESDVVVSERLHEIGCVRSVSPHCQRSLYPQYAIYLTAEQCIRKIIKKVCFKSRSNTYRNLLHIPGR